MASRRGRRLPRAITVIGVLIMVGGLALLAGLAIVDYRAAAAVLLGVAGAWLFVRLLRAVRGSQRRGLWLGVLAALVLVVAVAVVLAVTAPAISDQAAEPLAPEPGVVGGETESDEPRPVVVATAYEAIIRPGDESNTMLVAEQVVYDVRRGSTIVVTEQLLTFPERQVASEPRGFLLREVSITPLEDGVYQPVSFTLPDGGEMRAPLCTYLRCPTSLVQIEDFPTNAFFAARGVQSVETAPYVRTERISWTTTDLSDGITFAYIPPPFHHARPLLRPFVGAASLDDWVVGLVAMFATMLAAPLVMPVLAFIAEEMVGELIGRWFRARKEASTAGSSYE